MTYSQRPQPLSRERPFPLPSARPSRCGKRWRATLAGGAAILVLSGCVTPISFEDGRSLSEGRYESYFGVALNAGDPLARLERESPPDPDGAQERPPNKVEDVEFPLPDLPVSYAVGGRFGLGQGLELQFSGEAFNIAGMGLSAGLKWQFAGQPKAFQRSDDNFSLAEPDPVHWSDAHLTASRGDLFSAALKFRVGGAFAGAGSKEDGRSITLGTLELGLPISLHPSRDDNALFLQPRLGLLHVRDQQNDTDFIDSATVIGGGLTAGGLLRLGGVLLALEGSVLFVPQQNNLDGDALHFFGAIGLVIPR